MLRRDRSLRPDASAPRRSSRTTAHLATARGQRLRALIALWFSLLLLALILLLQVIAPDWTGTHDQPTHSSPAGSAPSAPPPTTGS